MQEISIELQLANRKYPLKIKESEAAALEKAAGMINGKLKEFGEKYGIKDMQDLFAMTALQIATHMVDGDKNHSGIYDQLAAKMDSLELTLDKIVSET